MMYAKLRVGDAHGALRVTLPKSWCRPNKVGAGMDLQALEHYCLIIFPPELPKETDLDSMIGDIRGAMAGLNIMRRNP